MPIPVSIDAVAEELDSLPDDVRVYVDRETGEILTAPNGDIGVFEDGEELEFEWEWEDEFLPKLQEIAERTGAWVVLPDKRQIHEWSLMQAFADEQREPLASMLSRAIHGRGAFRAFHDALDEAGRTGAWYKWKHEYMVKLASETLEKNGIPFTRGRV